MTKRYSQLAKIARPFLPEILPRTRLFNLLSAEHQRPVTWVCGPGGSGKTSLVASYLDTRKLRCIWYQVDAGDADVASFFYYLRLAGQKAAPHYRRPLPLLTPEYRKGLPVFTQRFFEELFRRLQSPCMIVLDNYQSVAPESEFHTVLGQGLAYLPEGISAIVISRHQPPPSWIGLRAGNRMALLDWRDIRLTEKETAALIRLKTRQKFTDDALALLHQKTNGWVAGLVLMIEGMAAGELDYTHLSDLTSKEVFDYFGEEVLGRLAPDTRDFLLKTALLPKMTACIADKLTGQCEASRILSDLHGNGFFTERHAGPEPIYQYHPLFRQFLMDRVQATFTRAEIKGIQRHAALLLRESGGIEEAAALLIDAEDWQQLVRLILAEAQTCIAQGRNKTMDGWLKKVPPDVMGKCPWLHYWAGVCRAALNPADSCAHFEKAFHLFEVQEEAAGALMAWSGVIQTYIFMCDNFKPLDRWIAWLDDYTREGVHFPSPEIHAAVASGMIGALEWRMPAHPDAGKWVREALDASLQCPQTDACLRAFTNCALYYGWMGAFAEGRLLIDEMRKISRDQSASPYRLILFKVLETILYNCAADCTERAGQAAAEGLEIARRTGVHVFDLHLYAQAICNSLNAGELEKGDALLAQMERVLGSGGRTHAAHYYFFTAWHKLLSGNRQVAMVYAQKSLHLIEEAGVPFSETVIRVLLVHILDAEGRSQQALDQLAEVKNMLPQTGSAYFAYLYHLTAAHFAFNRNDPEDAREMLRNAMQAGRREGFLTAIYFWLPAVIGRLCAEAIRADIEAAYARELIHELDLVPSGLDEEMGGWPWRFEIRALGAFEIRKDGEPFQASGKGQKKPLQMLKSLIALGPGEIRRERIVDALWPDAEGDAGNIAFHTTLHRLRRWIGDDRVICSNEGTIAIDRRYCQVDIWAFERLCDRAVQGPPDRELFDRAVALYKGAFLPADDDFLPTISVRERLRCKFLRLIAMAGQWFAHIGDHPSALNYYARGIESDPLAEELHQGLMTCYLELGRKAEAMAAYMRCKHLLQAELRVEPAPRTERLKHRILDS
jgi:LuxR family maltose regulon positive regulatory protein